MTDEQVNQNAERAGDNEPEPEPANPAGEVDLNRVRDLVLAAHPDVVPEMVQGATFDELMESVDPAREAYQRIASQAADAATRQAAPRVAVQPGRGSTAVEIESLSPLGKISEGLKRV